jgi:hypothetical protein
MRKTNKDSKVGFSHPKPRSVNAARYKLKNRGGCVNNPLQSPLKQGQSRGQRSRGREEAAGIDALRWAGSRRERGEVGGESSIGTGTGAHEECNGGR